MVKTQFGQAQWYARVLAILYAWTIGLVVAAIILPIAIVYAFLGSVLSLLDISNARNLPFRKPVRKTFEWWFSIHSMAISGTGVFSLVPPIFE